MQTFLARSLTSTEEPVPLDADPEEAGQRIHHTREQCVIPASCRILIKLLEDESPSVRESVYQQLITFGPSLETELLRVDLRLTSRELDNLHAWIRERSREWLRDGVALLDGTARSV